MSDWQRFGDMAGPTPPPPGTGGTLEQELDRVGDVLADLAASSMLDGASKWVVGNLSAVVRRRAARVRELVTSVEELAAKHGDDVVTPSQIIAGAYRALTGPLSPTEPAATPTEKGGL